MKKFYQLSIDLQESDITRINELKSKFNIDENQLFFMILKTGLLNGAKDYKSAFEIGIELQEEILSHLSNIQNLQNIANINHSPANIVEQNLRKNTQSLKDDDLINSIMQEMSEK